MSASSKQLSLSGLALVCLLIALSLTLPAASRAAELPVPVRSCSPDIVEPLSDLAQWQVAGNSEYEMINDCPTGLSIGNPHGGVENESGGWFWNSGRYTNATSVSFTVSGGDETGGLSYVYSDCGGDCENRTPLDDFFLNGPRTPDSEPERITVPMTLPYDGITLRATCIPSSCAAARPVVFSDFEITVDDSAAPYISGTVNGADIYPQGENDITWTNGFAVDANLDATDEGLGIYSASAELAPDPSDPPLWPEQNYCRDFPAGYVTTTAVCERSATLDRRWNLSSLGEGIHQLTINAADGLGNSSSTSLLKLGIDRTPPDAPANLHLIGPINADGWTGDASVTLGWDPPAAPADDEAPFTQTNYSLRKPSGETVSAGTVMPDATESAPIATPTEGKWRLQVTYTDAAGNLSERSYLDFGVDYDEPPAPTLDQNGWVSHNQLVDGYSQTWTAGEIPEELESGLCGYAVLTDTHPGTVPPIRRDEGPNATSSELKANLSEGRHYVHVRSVSCADQGSATRTEPLDVDGTAPTPVLTGISDAVWSRNPVDVTLSATDSGSGMASVHYAVGSGDEVTVPGQVATVHLGDGLHRLSYGATDNVGNRSDDATRVIGVDSMGPAIAIDPDDPSDRRRVSATVTDELSGVVSARLEYRRTEAGSPTSWTRVGNPASPSVAGANTLAAEFEIPDDQLPAGNYEFRVAASDSAGNASSSDGQSGIAPRRLRLPVRHVVSISADIADVAMQCRTAAGKRCKSVKACRPSAHCAMIRVTDFDSAHKTVVRPYGSRTALVGSALDDDGAPLRNANLDLQINAQYDDTGRSARVTTDSNGRYELPIRSGPTQSFKIQFAGDQGKLPAADTAKMSVRSGAVMTLSRKRLHSGQWVRFSGHLLGSKDLIPPGGKRVEIQFLTPDGWAPAFKSPQTDSHGRFSAKRKWPTVLKRGTFLFRIHVPAEQPWPYESGNSSPVRLTTLP